MKAITWSVVIPTYNRSHTIVDAITSPLHYYDDDIEIIVVDDGSTDNTWGVVAALQDKRVRYFHQENKGVNAARNFGAKKARGEFIILLDSDDELVCNALNILHCYIGQLSEVNFFGTEDVKTGRKLFRVENEKKYTYQEYLSGACHGEFLPVVKRSVFKKHQYREEGFAFEQYFWNTVIKEYGVFVSPKVLRLYSFEQENRISPTLLHPDNAQKRFSDYKIFLNAFGDDYKPHPKRYAELLATAGAYGVVSGEEQGKEYLSLAIKTNYNMRTAALYNASLLGKQPLTLALQLYSIHVRGKV